jgi:hypothetical protein
VATKGATPFLDSISPKRLRITRSVVVETLRSPMLRGYTEQSKFMAIPTIIVKLKIHGWGKITQFFTVVKSTV